MPLAFPFEVLLGKGPWSKKLYLCIMHICFVTLISRDQLQGPFNVTLLKQHFQWIPKCCWMLRKPQLGYMRPISHLGCHLPLPLPKPWSLPHRLSHLLLDISTFPHSITPTLWSILSTLTTASTSVSCTELSPFALCHHDSYNVWLTV